MEGWKGGRVEGWEDGRVEGWKGGRMGGGRWEVEVGGGRWEDGSGRMGVGGWEWEDPPRPKRPPMNALRTPNLNPIFIDCSAEDTKVGTDLGLASG